MADKLSRMLVMTPQLQMAIRLLAMPSRELPALVDQLRADHPGCVVDVGPDQPDLSESVEAELVADMPELPPLDRGPAPLPPLADAADVWVFGNPPRARANLAVLPRFALATDDADAVRAAKWLARALLQRARTYERIVGVLAERRPQLAIALTLDDIDPVSPREIAEAVGMHESTITRVATACRVQNRHDAFAIAPLIATRRAKRKRRRRGTVPP